MLTLALGPQDREISTVELHHPLLRLHMMSLNKKHSVLAAEAGMLALLQKVPQCYLFA